MTNEQMREVWTNETGASWVAHHRTHDRMLESILAELVEAITVEDHQRVLDVGCGTGTLTAAVAELGGTVAGTDISPTMIAGARARFPDIEFFVADAQVDDLHGPYDVIVSRFGVMFFADPVAAFANLAANAADGAALHFVCWRGLDDNEVFTVGVRKLLAAMPLPPTPDPHAPGPMAFADEARVRAILIDAGWTAIDIAPVDTVARFGLDGSDGIEERLTQMLTSESGRRFTAQVPEDQRGPGIAAARADLLEHLVDGEVQLHAAAWLVRARR
ncbi:MAG: type 11 methyltransferase [Ilumatobacteraceae bacterium]|nr:type 11 methyltransferase [Ilumatobacteraceae bacterium]